MTKKVGTKQVFVLLSDFEMQSKMLNVNTRVSHPASRTSPNVRNVTEVVKK